MIFTRTFWRDAAERSAKTFAQSLLGTLAVAGVTVLTVNWYTALAVAGTSTLISVLMSIVSLPVAGNGTASLVRGVIARRGRHSAEE